MITHLTVLRFGLFWRIFSRCRTIWLVINFFGNRLASNSICLYDLSPLFPSFCKVYVPGFHQCLFGKYISNSAENVLHFQPCWRMPVQFPTNCRENILSEKCTYYRTWAE